MDNIILERVLHLSRSLAETRTLAPLLETALDEAMSLVRAECGYLVLLKEDGSLNIRVKRGTHCDRTSADEDQISTSILRHVVDSAQPLIINDARADPTWSKVTSVELLGLRSVMCVPLIARGQILGAVYVENRTLQNCFDEDDLLPLGLFANQAAICIENATFNDALEEKVAARTRQLEANWQDAIEVNRQRVTLLGNLAHDLRAPLAIIISSLQLTLNGTLGEVSPDQAEWLGKSLSAAQHILSLAEDVLDLTKLEQHGLSLYPEVVDLQEFLTKVYRIGLALPWSPGVTLRLALAAELPQLALDPKRISQVLLNLLSNALKFTETGSVTLYAQPLDAERAVQIGVLDTGEGIPAEQLDQLFQRFHQVDTNQRRRQAGTGLGLAICRDLVEMHGGRMWVESTPHVGSNFAFALPLIQVEPS